MQDAITNFAEGKGGGDSSARMAVAAALQRYGGIAGLEGTGGKIQKEKETKGKAAKQLTVGLDAEVRCRCAEFVHFMSA